MKHFLILYRKTVNSLLSCLCRNYLSSSLEVWLFFLMEIQWRNLDVSKVKGSWKQKLKKQNFACVLYYHSWLMMLWWNTSLEPTGKTCSCLTQQELQKKKSFLQPPRHCKGKETGTGLLQWIKQMCKKQHKLNPTLYHISFETSHLLLPRITNRHIKLNSPAVLQPGGFHPCGTPRLWDGSWWDETIVGTPRLRDGCCHSGGGGGEGGV